MRAASEHPRIATTIAAVLIVLALAGVGAGRALGGAQPIHRSDRALRIADAQLAQLRQQLQTSETQSAQLRGQLATLTAELARARQSQQRAQSGTRIKRRRPSVDLNRPPPQEAFHAHKPDLRRRGLGVDRQRQPELKRPARQQRLGHDHRGLMHWGLIASVIAIVVGSMVWQIAGHGHNHHWAARGRVGALMGAGGALLTGAAPAIVNWAAQAGHSVH